MLARTTLAVALALALPSKALAYDTLLTTPLHEGRDGARVGDLVSALPTTITFRDATHARVTFHTSAFEIRGSVNITEGEARIRSSQHLVLSGSPFRMEVEPGTTVTLVDGRRGLVTLESALPIDGLDVTTLRFLVASEETPAPRDEAQVQACMPVHLWPAPRVQGPVIRTSPHAMFMSSPLASAPGWNEVWVRQQGVWLRGYTWEAQRCGSSFAGIIGGQVGRHGYQITRVSLPSQTRIGSGEGARWTVLVHEATEVELWESASRSFFRFPLSEGIAHIEGLVLP